ncbi:MAG: histidine kinase, partial [Gemmatimonadetes bacterium]|nr:histidine kinase [Gemmatimonadota bacterium]
YYARQSEARTQQLARAELQQLKSQLHPHFLFNTLNAISSCVRTDPEVATQTITRLSTLLRHALQRATAQEVSLDEELAVLEAYLGIEQLRFDDRLQVAWRVDPAARRAMVPHLVLQPLVENAIRHGITPRASRGTVEVAAERVDATLRLTVTDDGVGCDPAALSHHGVGLTNTRHRLQQLYGARHAMRVMTSPGCGMVIAIELPYREFRAA